MPLLDAKTRLVTLLGYPLSHSLSPLIHNTAFQAQGCNFVYVNAPVAPDAIEAGIAGLRALGAAGSNVTIPHKQAVLPLMDTLSPQAEAVGAVNTIVCQREEGDVRLHGDNTDIAGFLAPLHARAETLHGSEMLIFGAGGAARAVVYALLTTFAPSRLTIAARRIAQAEQLAEAFTPYDVRGCLAAIPLSEAHANVRRSRLLVNATPLGMHPHVERTPWPQASDFHANHIAYDLVYNPEHTRFLHDVQQAGGLSIGGLDMLLEQAAASYIQWTGVAMPLDTVRAALQKHLTDHAR